MRALAAAIVLVARVAAADAPAPSVLDVRIVQADGTTASLREAIGSRPTIVAFWATYCAPCAAEVPVLNRAAARWRERGLRVLGVALESDRERVAARAREWKIDYETLPLAPGSDDLVQRLFPEGLPAAAFVARGEVTRHDRILSDEELPAIAERLLGPPPPGERRTP